MNRLEDTFLLKHILRFEGLDNWPSEVPVMSQVNEFIPFICQVPFDYLFRDDPAAMAECTLLVQEYLDMDELFGNLDIYNFNGSDNTGYGGSVFDLSNNKKIKILSIEKGFDDDSLTIN